MPADVAPSEKTRIGAHARALKNKNRNLINGNDDAALFFDESKVPVEFIAVANEQASGRYPADFEVIGEKVSYRLAQRPSSYVILEYVRPVINLRADQSLSCPSAPVGYWTSAAPTAASSPAYHRNRFLSGVISFDFSNRHNPLQVQQHGGDMGKRPVI